MTEEIKENIKDLYIGVGSNLNEPFVQIERAIEALSHLDNFDSMKISNFYESAPMGPQNQNNYICLQEISQEHYHLGCMKIRSGKNSCYISLIEE